MIARCALAIFASPALALAQAPTLRIPAAPDCQRCIIEAVQIFTVGPIPGAAPGRDSHIARDSAGRYLLVVEPGPRVAVLDSVGKFIEFLDWRSTRQDTTARNVTVRIDRDGITNIFDGSSWTKLQTGWERIGLLDDYRVLGTGAVGLAVATTKPALTPHRTFATLRVRLDPSGPGPFGLPYSAGESPRLATAADQFEIDSVVSSRSCYDCGDLVLDVAFGLKKGAVWAATVDRYRIDLFYIWGKHHVQSIEVVGGWLPLLASYAPGRTLPEAPRLTGLVFDRHSCTNSGGMAPKTPPRNTPCERRLWVAGLTFADSSSLDESRRYATVVDVVGATAWFALPMDSVLTAARVVARTRLPGRVELFGPGLAYQRRALPNGAWAIDVYRLAVRGEQ